MNKKKTVKILLPALLTNEEQIEMTNKCRNSLKSILHNIEIIEDNNKYKYSVAEAWDNFFNRFRGTKYDFLMITANDTEMDDNAIDYAIKCLEEHPEAGVITFHVTRDHDKFNELNGRMEYNPNLTASYSNIDPACFILRKGVVERLGKIDFTFPCEFVERDYWYRSRLAGMDWIQLDQILCYHPPYAGTIGNDINRLRLALRKYVLKWGGDAGQEKYSHPYNDLNLDFTFAK